MLATLSKVRAHSAEETNRARNAAIRLAMQSKGWKKIAVSHFKVLLFTFRAVAGTGPTYLHLRRNTQLRSTRSCFAPLLHRQVGRKRSAGDHSIGSVLPSISGLVTILMFLNPRSRLCCLRRLLCKFLPCHLLAGLAHLYICVLYSVKCQGQI
jgi:hypothetical protein